MFIRRFKFGIKEPFIRFFYFENKNKKTNYTQVHGPRTHPQLRNRHRPMAAHWSLESTQKFSLVNCFKLLKQTLKVLRFGEILFEIMQFQLIL